jgi:uncharacterized damage-inducible protein DinB
MGAQSTKRNLQLATLPGYPPEIGGWLSALEDTRQRTKRTLEGIAATHIDYATTCIDNTIGTLLYHIAAIEADWLFVDVMQQEFPPDVDALLPFDVRDERGRLTLVQGVGLEEHLQRLDFIRGCLLEEFRRVSLEDYHRARHFDQYDVTPEWVLHHLCQHEAEHRGQILEARRLAEG